MSHGPSSDPTFCGGRVSVCWGRDGIPAKRRKVPIFHMEAGLRAYDRRMPEQRNRILIDHMSDILLPYNKYHRENLIRENIHPSKIMDAVKEIAETGANLEYDKFGSEDTGLGAARDQPLIFPSDVQRMQRIEQLIEWGHESQIVIAQDVCFKTDLTSHGGKGYSHILESIVPRMRKHGFSTENINNILIENPKRILTFT